MLKEPLWRGLYDSPAPAPRSEVRYWRFGEAILAVVGRPLKGDRARGERVEGRDGATRPANAAGKAWEVGTGQARPVRQG